MKSEHDDLAVGEEAPRRATGKPRNAPRFTVAQVEEALREALTQAGAAAVLTKKHKRACARSTVCQYVAKHPRLRAVFEECRETMLDIAETSLLRNVREGKEASTIFLLKTAGRARGYSERMEMEHTGGVVLRVKRPENWGVGQFEGGEVADTEPEPGQ